MAASGEAVFRCGNKLIGRKLKSDGSEPFTFIVNGLPNIYSLPTAYENRTGAYSGVKGFITFTIIMILIFFSP